MKMNNKKLENISAFIDDELNNTDKNIVSDELKNDINLQKEMNSLNQLKELVNELKPLPQDPYFETRLFEKIKQEKARSWHAFFLNKPIMAISAVTLILMVVFKFYPSIFTGFIDEQKANLMDIYAANLRPFILNVGLSSDDIFNFAFNKTITLDKEKNQVLFVGVDESGKDYFEVKFEQPQKLENNVNMASFVKSLKLNENQKKEFDSILLSYSSDLASQILVNDNKTVAVNPNILNYQNALRAEVMAFASRANKDAFARIFSVSPDLQSNEDLTKLVKNIKSVNNKNYLVITPDTIFSSSLDVDRALLSAEVGRMKNQIKNSTRELAYINDDSKVFVKWERENPVSKKNDLKIVVSEDFCKVEIPEFSIPEIPSFGNINSAIESAMSQFREMNVSIKIDSLGKKNSYSFKYKSTEKDSPKGFEVRTNMPDMNLKSLDSLQSIFKFFNDDTVMFNSKELRKEMERVKKEMERFREEMEKMRRELNPNTTPTKKEKSPIEI